MDSKLVNIVDSAMQGNKPNADELAFLCAIDPLSAESFYLRWASRDLTMRASNNQAAVFAQIGLDANPCDGDCTFCSFAKSNSSWTSALEISIEQIVEYACTFDELGIHLISLMSTCSYGIDRYLDVVEAVRKHVSDDLSLMANIDDFDLETAILLRDVGVDTVYHAPRLGEGQITRIPLEKRFATLDACREAGLKICTGVEPLRPDLDPREIAERILQILKYEPVLAGTCSLVPVPGSAWEGSCTTKLPAREVVGGALRLAAGTDVVYGNMNVAWVNAGTRPRGVKMVDASTLAANFTAAKSKLEDAGWEVPNKRDPRLLAHTSLKKTTARSDKQADNKAGKQAGNRIFLDNAATSSPKPPGVAEAIVRYLAEVRCSLNRDGHTETCESAKVSSETRQMLADLFGYPNPKHVVYTPSVTFSLNLLLKGFLHPDDHVIVSSMEHNAVIRPLIQLADKGLEYDKIPCDELGRMKLDAIEGLIKPNTKLILCTHASNVTGNIHPIKQIAKIAHAHDIPFAIDAAQTAGCLPIDMTADEIDVLCFAGHKSLMGPPGIGGIVMSQEIANRIEPLVSGGTGILSRLEHMPDELPLRFEAGTYNSVGIYGLHASLLYLKQVGVDAIRHHEMELREMLVEGIQAIPEARICGDPSSEHTVAVLSVDFPDYDNNAIAYFLSSQYGVATRRGIHCSPWAHEVLGTYPDGTIRFSMGYFNTKEDISTAIEACARAVKEVEKSKSVHGSVRESVDESARGSVRESAQESTRESVRKHYAQTARSVSSACCESAGESGVYSPEALVDLPADAIRASRGCADPISMADLSYGDRVLDLGCGGGIDCLLAAKLVGPEGHVVGVDMTDEMLEIANKNLAESGLTNVDFVKAYLEEMPFEDSSFDLVISNCVINLCADKRQVLSEAARVLSSNGKISVADIIELQPISEPTRSDLCDYMGSGSVLNVHDYEKMLAELGFLKPVIKVQKIYDRAYLEDRAIRKHLEDKLADIDLDIADGAFGSAVIVASKA